MIQGDIISSYFKHSEYGWATLNIRRCTPYSYIVSCRGFTTFDYDTLTKALERALEISRFLDEKGYEPANLE